MNLYVGNIAHAASEDEVRALFQQFGSVDTVNLIVDHETGRSRGYGFVTMSLDSEADAAIDALNGYDFLGRALTVNAARPRQPKEWSPSDNNRNSTSRDNTNRRPFNNSGGGSSYPPRTNSGDSRPPYTRPSEPGTERKFDSNSTSRPYTPPNNNPSFGADKKPFKKEFNKKYDDRAKKPKLPPQKDSKNRRDFIDEDES